MTDKSAHVSVNARDGGLERGWIDSHGSQQKLEGGNNISYFYCRLKNKHFFFPLRLQSGYIYVKRQLSHTGPTRVGVPEVG